MTQDRDRTGADGLEAAFEAARLVVLDVDGTLTEGRIRYLGDQELQDFCVRDGQGLVWLRRAGVAVAWISGRGCRATRRRAEELGVDEVRLRVQGKYAELESVQQKLGVTPAQTIAMGDDLPDLAFAPLAAAFVAPADAREQVRAAAQLVTHAPGGVGAVRELCERILSAKGRWPAIGEGSAR